MSGTVLNVQHCTDAGVTPTYQAAAAAQEVPNTTPVIIHVKTNSTAGGINVSIVPAITVDANVVATKVIAVAPSSEMVIGPFPNAVYNMANGNVQININTPANCVGIAVLEVIDT